MCRVKREKKSLYSQLNKGIRIYRRHQVTHGIEEGVHMGIQHKRREKEKNNEKRVKTGNTYSTSNHQTTQENTGNSHKLQEDSIPKISNNVNRTCIKEKRFFSLAALPISLCFACCSLVQGLSGGSTCPKRSFSTRSRSAVAPRAAWGRCPPTCKWPGRPCCGEGVVCPLCPDTPNILSRMGWR